MTANSLFPYDIVKRTMYNCTLELILDMKKHKSFCSAPDFRLRIFNLMIEKDQNIRDLFVNRVKGWVTERSLRIVGDMPGPLYVYDAYIERIFTDMMEEFCDEQQDLIPILKEWEASGMPVFRMRDIYMEEYQSLEEYEKLVEEARKVLKRYAEMVDIKVSKIKITLPYFEDPEDLIAYLEREMELMVVK